MNHWKNLKLIYINNYIERGINVEYIEQRIIDIAEIVFKNPQDY